MRKNILLGMAVGAILVLGSAGGAFAGEVNGKGEPNRGGDKAHSACVYSGLEDGSEDPEGPSGPGTVQNWGHTKNAPFITWVRGAAEVKATFDTPLGSITVTTGCNPHVGGAPE